MSREEMDKYSDSSTVNQATDQTTLVIMIIIRVCVSWFLLEESIEPRFLYIKPPPSPHHTYHHYYKTLKL